MFYRTSSDRFVAAIATLAPTRRRNFIVFDRWQGEIVLTTDDELRALDYARVQSTLSRQAERRRPRRSVQRIVA